MSRFACLLLILSAATTFAADPTAATSLIGNGNFEADTDADQWPDHWAHAKGAIRWHAEDGNHFLRMTSEKPGEMVMLYHAIKLPADVQALTLTWKMRCFDLKPGKQPWFDARLLLEFKDAADEKLAGSPSAPYTRKDTTGWVQRTFSFLVPEGAHTLEFMPALLQVEQGTMDLDDITLVPADPAPLIAAAKIAAAEAQAKREKTTLAKQTKAAANLKNEGSLITNGSFEADTNADAWPDQWGKLKEGGSWPSEGDNHFLQLQATSPGQMIVLYREIELPAGAQALELTWRQRTTDLKAGKEPYFDARIMLEFKDDAGKKTSQKPSPPYTRSSSDGWVEKKTQFLVPPEAVTLEFMPALFQVKSGTYDLDDFKLVPIAAAPLLAAKAAADELERLSRVPPEEPQKEKWPLELHVVGNQIFNSAEKPVWLQGVNVVSLEFSVRGEQVLKSVLVAVDEWKSNAIRLPVKEEYWFGRTSLQKDGGAAYRELVDQAITLAANRRAYTILDLHRFRAPNDDHLEFWNDAAQKYKNHPAVLFDLFNEPHGISWEVWRDGGFVAEKAKPADEDTFLPPEEKEKARTGFESPGMQKLVDAVRGTDAKNIVIAGGLDWAYDLTGIVEGFALDDKDGNGIVYSTHIYPWKSGWADKVLRVAEKHPIFVGEVGASIHKMSFIPDNAQEDPYTWVPDMLGLIQKHKLHWTAFSFHPKASPVLITGWDYTPTPYWGEFVKAALAGKSFELKKLR